MVGDVWRERERETEGEGEGRKRGEGVREEKAEGRVEQGEVENKFF